MAAMTWRPSAQMRVLYGSVGTLVGALGVGAIVWVVIDRSVTRWLLLIAAQTAAASAGFWLAALRSSITASEGGVIVRGLLSETFIPWTEVVACTPGYTGISIRRRDGSVVIASAVQKPNYATWLKRSTRADEIADEIDRRAHRSHVSER